MDLKSVFLFCALITLTFAKDCPNVKRINNKLICYYSKTKDVDSCYCTHVVLPANTDVKEIDNLRRKLRGVKILLSVNEFNQGLVKTVKQSNIDGLELNLKKLNSKEDITDFINTVRTKFGNNLFLALSIPPKTELLAKYYDLKALTKTTDLFILQTAFLSASKNVTFHPSRLSGLWDMQNTDSVVDLATGLGAPLSRLAVTAPVQAFQFRLQDSGMTTPGSPALELKTITRKELCEKMNGKEEKSWTLERDQDQAGPYIFRGTEWIAFEDPTSMDIKAKYTRVRGLAGLALKDLSQDFVTPTTGDESQPCSSLLAAAHAGLSKQNRAPRGAVLRSLEREILETPGSGHPLQKVNVSPFRITRVVDVEGHVHSVRKDTRTEFTCTRQGYFVHPQSCGRFYRCVKFDQLTDDFSVFEFDCPAGLAFDERVEVCVWPGSLPHGAPCQGSSEIAPVPRGRFKCPGQPGYYVDPENCRWFFACLDHGQSELTAYEFRCPFGLVFDEKHLLCQWPWLVPSCGQGYITGLELDSIEYYGGAAKSTLIAGQSHGHNLNLHLTAGAQVLDSYDGLGSLGAVALGGYHGDINILKNSLHSQELGLGNVNIYQGSGQFENTGALGVNLESAYLSRDNIGLHHSNSELNQGALGVVHFGTAITGENSNIGLLGQGKESIVNLQQSKIDSNFGGKITSADYHGSSGYGQFGQEGITLLNSGLKSGGSLINIGDNTGAVSSIEFNNYNKGNQETVLVNEGIHSGQSYQHGNDKLVLSHAVPVQQTVLLNSGINQNHNSDELILLNGAKSSSSNAQYFDNHGYKNTEQAVLLNSQIDDSHLLNTGIKSGTSFQTLQHSIPVHSQKISTVQLPVHSTLQLGEGHSGTLNYDYQYGDEGKYFQHGTNLGSVSFGTKLTHIGESNVERPDSKLTVNYASNYLGVTPKTDLFTNLKYEYQTPVVQYQQKVQAQSGGRKSQSYSQINRYHTPVVQYEQKVQPVVYEQKVVQPIIYEQKVQQPIVFEQQVQPVVLKTESKGRKAQSHSSTYHYQTPVVQYEQKIEQPVVYEQKVQQPIVFEQKVQPVVLKTESEGRKAQSHSSTYHYQTPVVQYEQKIEQPVVYEQEVQQPIVFEQQVQPVVLKTESEGRKAQSHSSTYHYQTPVVQYEQKIEQPVVYEQKVQQPIVFEQQVQPVVLKTETAGIKAQSHSSTYHYQNPVVQYEQKIEQPIVFEQKVQQPILYEQKVQPVVLKQHSGQKSQSYSQINHYHTPSVQFEQKVEQPVVYEQKIQPIVLETETGGIKAQSHSSNYQYQHPIVQYEQKVEQPVVYEQKVQQPIIFEQKVQPAVLKQHSGRKSQSYAQINHYHNPSVQFEQKVEQPIVYEQKVEQPIVFEQNVQPVVLKTEAEGIKAQSHSSTYHYQSPVVQYEQKIEQPVVYEQKVQQPIVFEQKVQPVVLKQHSGRKSQSYAQINHYHTPSVQFEQKVEQPIAYEQKVEQPIVFEQKIQPVVLKTDTEGIKAQSHSSTYHYQSPVVQYEQKIEQPVVYEQEVQQPIIFGQKVQPVVLKTEGVKAQYHYQNPVVQYEQKVQPVQYENKVQPVVYKTESEGVKSQSYSSVNHYHTPVVQYEQKVEQPILVQQNVELKTPVVQQEILLHTEIKTPVVPIVHEAKQHAISSSYHYEAPRVQYEQNVQPIVQYEQKVQPQINVYKTNLGESKTHTQFYGVHHNIATQEIKTPVVQQEILYPKVQHISITPKYEKVEDIKFSSLPVGDIKQTAYSTSFLKHDVPTVQYEQKVPIVEYEQKVEQPIVFEQKVQPTIYKTESEDIKSHSYSQAHHYQTPVVQYEQKVQPIIHQNIEFNVQQPEILTVTPKYETQYFGKKIEHVSVPTVQKESVVLTNIHSTPQYHEINIPVVKQPSSFVSKVNIPISVTPKYDEYQPIQPISYENKLPVIEPKIVQKIVQPLYEINSKPEIVNTYQESRQYLPPKPIVNTVYISSTPKPEIYVQPKQVYVSTTPKYSVFQEYVQPKQTFEIKKTVQPVTYQTFTSRVQPVTSAPTIVESYSYLPPKENKQYLPARLPEVYVSTTPKYEVFQDFVQPKQTFELKKTISPTVISEYQYENPDFVNYESNLNFKSVEDLSYQYQPVKLPKVQPETVYYSTQKPVIPTLQTIPIKNYQTDYILSTPKPNFVSTIAPIIKQTPTLQTKVVAIDKYETLDNKYLVSTPKPFYISTSAPLITKTEQPLGEFKYYDSRFDTNQDLYNQFGNYEYVEDTPKVNFVTSSVRPIQRKKIVSTTTQLPLDTYYDDIFDSQYIVSSTPKVVTTYRPQIRKNYYSTTTEQYNDNLGYVVTPVQRKKIVPLDNDYVVTTLRPILKRKKIVTTALPIDYDDYLISSVRPESIKITPRPKGKTIVRVNDFHPFLTTKLGAQCTCVSNTLKLRKSKQHVEIPEYELPDSVPITKLISSGPASYDDYNEPGVYVVGNSDISDYGYEPRNVVAVTKSPEYLIKSTTNAVQPAPTPVYTIRRKVTTVRPSSTPASAVVDEVFLRSKSKEEKIAEAVNEGLSLVKSAIKGYVKDAVEEEVHNFDRFGPGGWRSRDETLQGSVDCQRAGLFRHPTQCNKFYACHWDCTKQRYTLHVFNCPVHLTFDTNQGACNWPSKGPACTDNTLLPSS